MRFAPYWVVSRMLFTDQSFLLFFCGFRFVFLLAYMLLFLWCNFGADFKSLSFRVLRRIERAMMGGDFPV